ncbi:uncharacterized protein AMSG_04089 [Thecamonas trahens ATCC 50062]|uniref:Uncharacterized protein n=1 Tax=Thecamonas trahens ATCC 50062 TaxID=461836 RepID=A0A0L0D677_THETB|nr:hypothetical protein AMSG_04089 [Thecamonas trahens ATCC 50062]KNC47859.1 hypothetical protein AMSG_04089 [Thecamonas trahens ATCC 50062]|eukprot:XP_013759337.1 hypothetical protein AMSG_04089 [Thecamonas trahens ATCC 50062]
MGADRSKALVLIGDDVPHEPSYTDQNIRWRDELEKLMEADIKIYAVQANHNKKAAPFYEELAEKSGGFLVHLSQLDWIEHMFVALCYRQHSPDKFENYRLDLIWENKLTHASPLNTLFMEMQTPVINRLDPSYTGHLTQGWWAPDEHDLGTPRYRWAPSTRTWKRDPKGRKGPPRKRKRSQGGSDSPASASASRSSARNSSRAPGAYNDSSDDEDYAVASGDGGAAGGRPAKRAKKAPAPVRKVTSVDAVRRMTKKAQVSRQLALRRRDPPPGYPDKIVVGGGANDTLQAMKDRLLAVMAHETSVKDDE